MFREPRRPELLVSDAPLWSSGAGWSLGAAAVCVTRACMWAKIGEMPTFPAPGQPRVSRALVRQRLLALAVSGLQFAAMTLVGMLAVWALVLLFG